MTKEELKIEAESKLDEWSDPDMGCCEGYCYSEVADFMFRFSEPREKRIAELEEDIQNLEGIKLAQETALSNEYIIEEQLQKENADLKEQIEKMRNFQNCDYQLHIIDCPIFKSGGHISCKKCPHWILQEADE